MRLRFLLLLALALALPLIAQACDAQAAKNGLIVYVDLDAGGQSQVFTILPDGSEKRQLTDSAGGHFYPAWSYDGKSIAFTSGRTGQPELWVMDADGASPTQLTFPPDSGNFIPSWSRDGTRIVFASNRTGHPEVWVMNADGTGQVQLTTTTTESTTRKGNQIIWGIHGSFSPDAQKIVYASTESGRSQIWRMDADGSNPVQLTTPGLANYPDANASVWSPDGTKIAFWSGFEAEYGDLFVMDPDGGNRTQLTFEAATPGISSDNPAWSPDGLQIMFDTNRSGSVETWVINADGSDPHQLFSFAYGSGRLPWQPVPALDLPVGGVAGLPDVAVTPEAKPDSSDGRTVVMAAVGAGVAALASAAWYARRRLHR